MSTETIPNDPQLRKILIVDDEQAILATLRELLTMKSFLVTTENDPEMALERIQKETFTVVMTDQDMPGMTGLALLAKVKELSPATTRLLITGKIRLREMAEAADAGILHRHIPKPYMFEDLVLTLRSAVERYQLTTENAALRARQIVADLKPAAPPPAPPAAPAETAEAGTETAVEATTETPTDKPSATSAEETGPVITDAEVTPQQAELAVNGLVKMLYMFHPNLGNTSIRAVALARTVGQFLELPPEKLTAFLWAAALHDVGLVSVEREIVRRWLRSAEKCTPEELTLIKKHPERSEELLQYSPVFHEAGEIIRSHHEHWDGTGYPFGLKEEMIPWISRVLAVIVNYCNYSTTGQQQLKEIEAQADKMFDSRAIQLVAKAVPLTRMPLGEREILLMELKPGMVLAREIFNAHGMLLLPKGRELNDASIYKVWSINRMAPIDQIVLVYA